MECEIPPDVTEVSILLTNDREIQKLNSSYRGKDKATDILSFPLLDKNSTPVTSALGDLVISLETAKRQAVKYKHSLNKELERLIVHGILHLLGYDHEKVTKNEAERMRRKERKLTRILLEES